MNKKLLIYIFLGIFLIGGIYFLQSSNLNEYSNSIITFKDVNGQNPDRTNESIIEEGLIVQRFKGDQFLIAICDKNNFCRDYFFEFERDKLVKVEASTGNAQFPTTEEETLRLKNLIEKRVNNSYLFNGGELVLK